MRWQRMRSPFAAYGDEMWGAIVRGRYSFIITKTDGRYAASWKDGLAGPRQAQYLTQDAATLAEAKAACEQQEKRLRPN